MAPGADRLTTLADVGLKPPKRGVDPMVWTILFVSIGVAAVIVATLGVVFVAANEEPLIPNQEPVREVPVPQQKFEPLERTLIKEEWADGLGAWEVAQGNASADCERVEGCAMRLHPPAPGTFTWVTFEPNQLRLRDAQLSFPFMASKRGGDHEAGVRVLFTDGSEVDLTLTDGPDDEYRFNDRIALTSWERKSAFATWQTPDTWFTITLDLDLDDGTVRAGLWSDEGERLARSTLLELERGSLTIESVSFWLTRATDRDFERYLIGPVTLAGTA